MYLRKCGFWVSCNCVHHSVQALMKYFGSLPRTMMTLYQGISGGIDWLNAVEVLAPVSWIIEYIFSAYVFFTVFCCLNIITGIFVDNAKALKVADLENMNLGLNSRAAFHQHALSR